MSFTFAAAYLTFPVVFVDPSTPLNDSAWIDTGMCTMQMYSCIRLEAMSSGKAWCR